MGRRAAGERLDFAYFPRKYAKTPRIFPAALRKFPRWRAYSERS
jgi:hypothetical protein